MNKKKAMAKRCQIMIIICLFINQLLKSQSPPSASFQISVLSNDCYEIMAYNTSSGDTGVAAWLFVSTYVYDSIYLFGDTAHYSNYTAFGNIQSICLFVLNQYGADTFCVNYYGNCRLSLIENLDNEFKFAIYPNPATNQLTINLSGMQAKQVSIYNVDGKLVSETKQPTNNRIDISNLAVGVYIAEVKVRDAVQRVRWVKM